ncbi:FadR/GntR family transcriptional regulator [Catenuloplanes atrovinosus]|uniref:FadR/GntR family transcriptional regulator n=1 Tax=Catenuloplanes atrovinosus TaxID=137266 RepID=UPI0035B56CC3
MAATQPDVVITQIRRWIAEGRFAPGDRLPPGREIATSLGVGLGSLREAVRVMETSGEIVCQQGRGRWVAAARPVSRCTCGCACCCPPSGAVPGCRR